MSIKRISALFCFIILAFTPIAVYSGVMASMWIFTEPTKLMKAAQDGDEEEVGKLIKNGADISEENENKVTPLIYAASKGRVKIVRYLLSKGANPNACAWYNMCPLWFAVSSNSLDSVKLLLASGADAKVNPDINALEMPALNSAAASGRLEIVKLLIKNGANIEHHSQPWGDTALTDAVSAGQTKTAQYLIKKGANIREATEKSYDNGKTALEYAKKSGHIAVVKMVEKHLKKISYKPKYSLDAIIDRLFTDPNFDMPNERGELDSILKQQTRNNLRLIRNTIFARKNFSFDDTALTEFYESRFPKYKPKKKKIKLSDLDKRNIQYIQWMENYAMYRDAAG